MKKIAETIFLQIFLIGFIIFEVLKIISVFQTKRSIDTVGRELGLLIIFLPMEIASILGFINKKLKSKRLAIVASLIIESILPILGLFFLAQGIRGYLILGYLYTDGNLAPVALIICGSFLSFIGIIHFIVNYRR